MDMAIKEEGFDGCEPDSFKLLDRYISSSDQEYERCLDIINVKRNIEELPWNPAAQRDQEIIRELQNQYDICCTPMQQLEVFVEDRCRQDQHSFERIIRRVGATKKILKRERAKERTFRKALPIVELQKEESTVCSQDDDKMCELKKRNRISAQISRDRKKVYVTELEKSNTQYRLECQRLKQQNEELRRKLETQQQGRHGNSQIVKLLAFLGVLFLVDLLRRSLEKRTPSISSSNDRVDRREQREFTQIFTDAEEAVSNSDLRGSQTLETIKFRIRELGGYLQQSFVRTVLGSTLIKSFLRVVRGLP